ncbi:MAG TPA: hypothetical protein VIK97_00595 [Casimicrobiaceae bacterium]
MSRLKVFHVDHASTRGGTTRFRRRREAVMFVPRVRNLTGLRPGWGMDRATAYFCN